MPKDQGYYGNSTGKPGKGMKSDHPTPKMMKKAQTSGNPFAKVAKGAARGK